MSGALVFRILAEAGKVGLQVGASSMEFGDTKRELDQREAQLKRRIALEGFFGQQLAEAAAADLLAGQGDYRCIVRCFKSVR